MAERPATNLSSRFKVLWEQSQGNVNRFLFAAYQESAARTSVMEVREGLDWLNSLKVRAGLRPLRLAVITNFVIQGLQDPLELFLVLLGFNPEIEYHEPYQFEAGVAGAEALILLIDYAKLETADGAAGHPVLHDWVARLRSGAPEAKILLNEPYLPSPQYL